MNISVLISENDNSVIKIDTTQSDSKFQNFGEKWIDLDVNIESTNLGHYNIVNAGSGYENGNNQSLLTLTKIDNSTVTANVDIVDGRVVNVHLPVDTDGFVSCTISPYGSNTNTAIINVQTIGDAEYNSHNLKQAIPGNSKLTGGIFYGPISNTDDKMKEVRNYRDYLLSQSDWTDTLSAQTRLGSKYAVWQNYRQALRDIPQKNPNPYIVIWPTIPN